MHIMKMFAPDDLRPTIEITAFTLIAVSTLVVATRFFCRVHVVGRLKLYDYLMLGAVLSTWALCVCNHYQLKCGTGLRYRKWPPHMTQDEIKAQREREMYGSAYSWYAYHLGYLFTLALVKLSILIFYLSFATRRTFRILVYTCIGMVGIITIAMMLLVALQCPKKPRFALTPGIMVSRERIHCFDLRIIFYCQAAFNMISDLVILVLPMPLLFRLRMDRTKRLLLLVVFSIGLLVPIASGVRLWGLYLWANSGRLARYYGGYMIFWSQVEVNTAIICASAPSLQPLFKCILHRIPLVQRSRGAYYYYGGGRNSTPTSPCPPTAPLRPARCDSLDGLESTAATYEPKTNRHREPAEAVVGFSKEEEIRARVRALSSPSPSMYSPTTSPSRPQQAFTKGWM